MKIRGNLNVPQELCGYSDMDYVEDNDTCIIVTGYIFLLNVVIMACYSKSQKPVALYVAEAEYS